MHVVKAHTILIIIYLLVGGLCLLKQPVLLVPAGRRSLPAQTARAARTPAPRWFPGSAIASATVRTASPPPAADCRRHTAR